MKSPGKLLAEAKNAAGDRAVAAARRHDHLNARAWQAIAIRIDSVFRDAISAEASVAAEERIDDVAGWQEALAAESDRTP